MEWQKHGKRWENSVLQLKVTKAIYNALRPYKSPHDSQVSGTGFVLDIQRGIIATNAHVVSNSISIVGRVPKLGKDNLSLSILCICREKDLALCKLSDEDIIKMTQGMENPTELNMELGDNISLNKADKVMAIGYPLGDESIKLTTGDVAGFHRMDGTKKSRGDFEDSYNRDPSYIQITAPINPGNSGGPLLNIHGKVVGINAAGYLFAQNIGYAIGSRTLLAIYLQMLQTKILKVPTFALEWCKTNISFMKLKTNSEQCQGIVVREIYKDSCLIYAQKEDNTDDENSIQKGDIIIALEYKDPFWSLIEASENYHVCNNNENQKSSEQNKTVTCHFDRFGDISLYHSDKTKDEDFLQNGQLSSLSQVKEENTKLLDRNFGLDELADIIPIGSEIRLYICRNKEWKILNFKYEFKESNRLVEVYPRIESYDYEIFAGLCITNLKYNHLHRLKQLQSQVEVISKYYCDAVVVCQVFPDTSACRTQTISVGDIITKINDIQINSLEDVRKIISENPETYLIETHTKSLFAANKEEIIIEDQKVLEKFSIDKTSYKLN